MFTSNMKVLDYELSFPTDILFSKKENRDSELK